MDPAPLYIAPDGTEAPGHFWNSRRPGAIIPGAFNPLHAGHWGLAEVAAELLDLPVAFELSRANVDKPELSQVELQRRLAQFSGRAPVWVTQAPRFVQKARLFPGATFVVGADTALRIVAARYYESQADMLAALTVVRAHGCRFLVAPRADASGRCLDHADVPVPAACADLFAAIPTTRFRLDISSTELRARGQHS
jgi:nicotinic acid mononucleotide adenylyltransferase